MAVAPLELRAGRLKTKVGDIRSTYLENLPLRGKDGRSLISDTLIALNLEVAENKLELDLDVVLGLREIRCVRDQRPLDDEEDDAEILPALNKPRNWFAGDRNGSLILPKRPVREVLKVRFYPSGRGVAPIDVPNANVRHDWNTLSFVAGKSGFVFGGQPNGTGTSSFSIFSYMQAFDDRTMIPGSLEVIYQAGLSVGEIKRRWPLLVKLVMLEAAILTLTDVQVSLGGGVQKESASMDALSNTVELANRSLLGALGGEIKALKANFTELMKSAQSQYGYTWIPL